MSTAESRKIIVDGMHTKEVLNVLRPQIGNEAGVASVLEKAVEVLSQCVDPIAGPTLQPSDGLLYGLIQSGKTSVITVVAALAADNGFQAIIVLTSDIDLLYDQTLERLRKALRGLRVLGKDDWRDPSSFGRQVRTAPFVIICSKNGRRLNSLLEAFRHSRAKGLSALIIDDEADQASLNTRTNKPASEASTVNRVITDLRHFFLTNTYLQVTATPQALFLQKPDHPYRPSFTVLTSPGHGYIGGEVFFGDNASLLRSVDLAEINQLKVTNQPNPSNVIPQGLKNALCSFIVGGTARIMQGREECYSFLCHVSVNQRDHAHIVTLIERFKETMMNRLNQNFGAQYERTLRDLRGAYDDLAETEPALPAFESVVERIKFYLPGATARLVNASSNEEIGLESALNLFVGGNKLGRGVTIRNLLVSYYGRNPKHPNADTVLQHARMYGYRQQDLGVTRLFLPDVLAEHFGLIHQMEEALRDLVSRRPKGQFEGLFITRPLQATRRNVLDPNSIGLYVAGRSYNPIYPLRDMHAVAGITAKIDEELKLIGDAETARTVNIENIIALIKKCKPDPKYQNLMWQVKTLEVALEKINALKGDRAYLVVRRDRDLQQPRHETAGIISGGEGALAPTDAPTLFYYRQNANPGRKESAVWWPQLRFPAGNYVLAFSFER